MYTNFNDKKNIRSLCVWEQVNAARKMEYTSNVLGMKLHKQLSHQSNSFNRIKNKRDRQVNEDAIKNKIAGP